MRRGRTEMARFIASGRELCSQELKFLEQLPQMQVNVTLPDYEEKASEPDKASEKKTLSAKEASGKGVALDKKEEKAASEAAPRLDELKFGQSLKKD